MSRRPRRARRQFPGLAGPVDGRGGGSRGSVQPAWPEHWPRGAAPRTGSDRQRDPLAPWKPQRACPARRGRLHQGRLGGNRNCPSSRCRPTRMHALTRVSRSTKAIHPAKSGPSVSGCARRGPLGQPARPAWCIGPDTDWRTDGAQRTCRGGRWAWFEFHLVVRPRRSTTNTALEQGGRFRPLSAMPTFRRPPEARMILCGICANCR